MNADGFSTRVGVGLLNDMLGPPFPTSPVQGP